MEIFFIDHYNSIMKHLRSKDYLPSIARARMHMHARWTVEHPYQIFSARMSADRGWNIKGAEGGAARMARMASPRRRSLFYRSSREQ